MDSFGRDMRNVLESQKKKKKFLRHIFDLIKWGVEAEVISQSTFIRVTFDMLGAYSPHNSQPLYTES